MKIFAKILTYLFGAIMILAGLVHFFEPGTYVAMVPGFLPAYVVIYLSGVIEIAVGMGAFILRFRTLATLVLLLMMIVYLPLHIIDVFKVHPAIGSQELALFRLPFQFVLIAWAWFIYRKSLTV
jgi:uncharacterized membrane protein